MLFINVTQLTEPINIRHTTYREIDVNELLNTASHDAVREITANPITNENYQFISIIYFDGSTIKCVISNSELSQMRERMIQLATTMIEALNAISTWENESPAIDWQHEGF
jgi:hypothetical protein